MTLDDKVLERLQREQRTVRPRDLYDLVPRDKMVYASGYITGSLTRLMLRGVVTRAGRGKYRLLPTPTLEHD